MKIKYEISVAYSLRMTVAGRPEFDKKLPESITWLKCRTAHVTSKGWLEYKLRDGTTGISAPGNFREV